MSLPVIRGSTAALYPFKVTISFLTGIGQWQNGSQQRWIKRASGLIRAEIPYGHLTQAQKNTVMGGFSSAKGRFDNTQAISLPIVGGTLSSFSNFYIVNDEIEATEDSSTIYQAPLVLHQVIPQNLSPGTPGQAFPTLSSGAIGQRPYSQKKRYQTVLQAIESGPSYAFAEFAGSLSGYPSNGLMAWEFNESLDDTDLAIRINHFINNWGKAYSFSFTDEDGTTYTNTHYAMDDLVIEYSDVNISKLTISLEATS